MEPPSFALGPDGALPAAAVDAYRRDGCVCLRSLFTPAEVALLSAGVDAVAARPGPLARVATAASDSGGVFFEDFCRWGDVAEYAAVARGSAAARVAAALMRSPTARWHHDHTLVKRAGTASPTPFHQDAPYYGLSGAQTASLWCPVDPVPLDASLQLVAGSHTAGMLLPRRFATGEAAWFPEGSLPEVPPLPAPGAEALAAMLLAGASSPSSLDESAAAARPPPRLLSWSLAPGDAVAFDFLTLHGSGGSAGERRVVSLRFVGADAAFEPRPWGTSPPFEGLRLAAGAPLDHPLFPVLWP